MTRKKHNLLLGAHISIAGGLEKAIERGESIGCTTIQIFIKNNRQWHAKKLSASQIKSFKSAVQKSSIKSIVAHATYLINLGSSNKETEEKSIIAIKEELKRCDDLNIPYLVLHPGSYLKTNEKACIDQVSNNLNEIFKTTPSKAMILLETMSGQGTGICYKFEQIAQLYKQSKFKKKLGICFDTCHAFAAGYDFRTRPTYEKMWKNFDQIIGLQHLKVIHVNDSKRLLGSRVDRHADIGKGQLDLNAFRLLFNDQRFFDIPKILETPKETLKDDLKNMEVIKKLLLPKTRKILNVSE